MTYLGDLLTRAIHQVTKWDGPHHPLLSVKISQFSAVVSTLVCSQLKEIVRDGLHEMMTP